MDELHLDFMCTYKLLEEETEEEKGLKNLLYNMQLLQMFNLNNYDENNINSKIDMLYDNIKNEKFIEILINENPYKKTLEKNELVFRVLFSYDYFDLFHKCLHLFKENKCLDDVIALIIKEYSNTK